MQASYDPKQYRQNLLIDADDTLWENNIYFERAIANFVSFLNHQEYSPADVRKILNEVERESIVTHGYGLKSFAHALVGTFERCSVEPVTPQLHKTIHTFAHAIAEQPMEIIPGVLDTLAYLNGRHRMIVMTKGDYEEQFGKVERSGLGKFFEAVEIVREKDLHTYGYICEKYGLDKDVTWMIGNSPKSDINPALAAGLHAVFVPHADTWVLEHEHVNPAPRGRAFLQLERFEQLRNHF